MAKKRQPNRNATRRATAVQGESLTAWESALRQQQPDVFAARQAPQARLQRVADRLADLVQERSELVAQRDALVAQLRTEGWSWKEIAAVAGVSHAALVQRRERA